RGSSLGGTGGSPAVRSSSGVVVSPPLVAAASNKIGSSVTIMLFGVPANIGSRARHLYCVRARICREESAVCGPPRLVPGWLLRRRIFLVVVPSQSCASDGVVPDDGVP